MTESIVLNFNLFQIIGIALGLIIAGEALALLAGLLFFKKPSLEWVNAGNIALVLSDLLLGGYLIKYYFGIINNRDYFGILAAVMVLIATHSFRASQTLRMIKNPYCFNRPLGIVNWIKLAGLFVLFFFAAQGQ